MNSISEEQVIDIIKAVKDAGVECLSDLQYLREEDLRGVLKPVQRRKLIKCLTEQCKYTSST